LFVRTQTNGSRTYLLPVDNIWADGKVKQRVLARLGRLDELLASGQLDALVQSLARFSEKLCLLGAHARAGSLATRPHQNWTGAHLSAALAVLFHRQGLGGFVAGQWFRVPASSTTASALGAAFHLPIRIGKLVFIDIRERAVEQMGLLV
jgi:hypothetical protein